MIICYILSAIKLLFVWIIYGEFTYSGTDSNFQTGAERGLELLALFLQCQVYLECANTHVCSLKRGKGLQYIQVEI